jgi:hypothetical protein
MSDGVAGDDGELTQIKGAGPVTPQKGLNQGAPMPPHTLTETVFLSGILAAFAVFMITVGGAWIFDSLPSRKIPKR